MPNKVEKDEVEEVEAGDVEAVEDKNKDRKHDWGAADLEKVWRLEWVSCTICFCSWQFGRVDIIVRIFISILGIQVLDSGEFLL